MVAIRARLTFANVMSVTAVFIALGGSAIAINKIKANSVGSKQLKTGAVKNADLADNSVTSPKVQNGSLKEEDFGAGQLPAGATGPQGQAGATGPQGAQGATGTVDTSNFYDKAASDARFLGIGATASNSTQLNGFNAASYPKATKEANQLVESGFARIGFARTTLPAPSGMTPILGVSFLGSLDAACGNPAQPSFRFSNGQSGGAGATVDLWVQNMVSGVFEPFATVAGLSSSANALGTAGAGGQSRFHFIVGAGNTASGQTRVAVFDVTAVNVGTTACTIQVQSQSYTL